MLGALALPTVAYAANITGTSGPDALAVTEEDDTISGFSGDDTIFGLADDDSILGVTRR